MVSTVTSSSPNAVSAVVLHLDVYEKSFDAFKVRTTLEERM